jgi:hypothetical protein
MNNVKVKIIQTDSLHEFIIIFELFITMNNPPDVPVNNNKNKNICKKLTF